MGIPASKRLRTKTDFLQVRNEGMRSPCGPFIFQWRRVDCEAVLPPRLGIIASRRVGNAVKRNLGKRRMREIFRMNSESIPNNVEIVVVLRSSFDQYSYAKMESRFLKACKQAESMA